MAKTKTKPKTIQSAVLDTRPVRWKALQFIQTGDFKEMTQTAFDRLVASIKRNGFVCPFFVWEDRSTGVLWCLDGFHRKLVMEHLDRDGLAPDELPGTFIDAKDLNHARQLVLTFSSVFAKVTMDGLYTFINQNELDPFDGLLDSLDIPGLSMDEFKKFYLDPDPEAGADKEPTDPEAKESAFRPGDIVHLGVHKIVVGDGDCWQIDKVALYWEKITGGKMRVED